jgi:hypothetical protein
VLIWFPIHYPDVMLRTCLIEKKSAEKEEELLLINVDSWKV